MKIFVFVQYVLPKRAITWLAGNFANYAGGRLTTAVIHWFVKRYNVNMLEAENSNINSYKTFNQFFTRSLKHDARPIANAKFICPVDGAISQFGKIQQDQIYQAKNHLYSTFALLAGNRLLADSFINGSYATLYLSPKDYHRIHMPCAGTLKSMAYVPGELFSVNPVTAESVAGLFARNERVVCEFEGEYGKFLMVLVGATIVGSMKTKWHGIVNPPRVKQVKSWQYDTQNIHLKQGEEMGQFLLGSTVIMLFENDVITFNEGWYETKSVCLGEKMDES